MRSIKLRARVGLYLFITLSVAMTILSLLIIKQQREGLENEASRHVTQIAEVVVASTRYTMLVNKREIAEEIIDDIAKLHGIERVRIISADGTIIHSNSPKEVGYSVEQNEEPCVNCHQTSKPLTQVPDNKRWKITGSPQGGRIVSTMHAIRNERSCSSASCHEHTPSQSVLGIVDIAYSLNDIDQSINKHAFYVIGISVCFVLFFSFSIGILLQRLIYIPLKDLESGAGKIASGDLSFDIPVRNDDEFGHVADSFNNMTTALNNSRMELQKLVDSLESKVKERTQELSIVEAEVEQGEKLASIGLLASGIAHELNNPLTGVLTFSSLLRKKMQDGSEDAEDLDLVIRETKRCASIIKRLLDFSREKIPTRGLFNLNQIIEETVHFIDRSASLQNIRITTDLDPELPQLWGDADLIKQVILNLLVNAEQAIEAHGNISVESRRCIATDHPQLGVEDLQMVEIAIKDTGCGISEANLQRIFDPFFTTKGVGKGTGLGLSVSHGIIKAHGGRLKVESIVGEGSTFHIYLPITAPFDETERNAGESTQ